MPDQPKWEYKLYTVTDTTEQELLDAFNTLGAHGWEIVGFLPPVGRWGLTGDAGRANRTELAGGGAQTEVTGVVLPKVVFKRLR